MKDKIINHAKTEYQSSPHTFKDEQLDILIANQCMCGYCGVSIFELKDFPEVLVKENDVVCEECYNEHYREWCNECGAYKDTDLILGECKCKEEEF